MINNEDLGLREDGGVSLGTLFVDSEGNGVEIVSYGPKDKQEFLNNRIHKMLDSAANELNWNKYWELIELLHNLTWRSICLWLKKLWLIT